MAETNEGCFYNFYLNYVLGDRGEDNYFSNIGTLTHELIEKYNKGELFDWDLPIELEKQYALMQYDPPFPAMGKKYRQQINDFFLVDDFSQYFKDYKILEMEDEKVFKVGEYEFKGYPDMVGEHTQHGLSIVDYKTAKKYEGKKLHHNIMQLYLYAIPIKEKYGKYPDSLIYFYPREDVKEDVIKFNMKDMDRTIKFVMDIIPRIEKFIAETEKDSSGIEPRCNMWNSEDFYANQLCNFRNKCVYKV